MLLQLQPPRRRPLQHQLLRVRRLPRRRRPPPRLRHNRSQHAMKKILVADLAARENQTIEGFFAAGSKSARSKKDGTRYLALTLTDKTGPIEARVWDAGDAGDFEA